MKFDRYSFIGIVVILFFSILIYSFAKLTLVEGAEYRKISDEKRVREIITTPPRGEILDRNGQLLAGNKAGFTVQLQKDVLNSLPREEKNKVCLSLVRLLESDGVDYLNDYPIILNTFSFKGNLETNEEEYVIDTIINNGLIEAFLNCDRDYYKNTEFYRFTIGDRILKALKKKEGDVPIEFVKGDEAFILKFKEGVDLNNWLKGKGLDEINNPYALLSNYIKEDKGFARKALLNPVARRATYDFLVNRGLAGNLILNDFSLSFDEKYLNQKAFLKNLSANITDNSSATFDFCTIFDEKVFSQFMENIYPPEKEGGKPFSIQMAAIRFLNENGVDTDIEVSLSKDGSYHLYNYRNGFDIGDKTPGAVILDLLREHNMVRDFLTLKEIRFLAQNELIKAGINPGISISDVPFSYTSIKEKKDFLTSEKLIEDLSNESSLRTDARRVKNRVNSAESLFNILREKYEIDENLSDYEARALLSIDKLLKGQGFLAYQPINFAYNVSDRTVATLEESFGSKKGITISVEPVRYYPFNNVASHVLGYIGKISQDSEIEEFVKNKGYQKSDFIGKTGLENAMEDILRGTPGKKIIEVDAIGNTTNEVEETLGAPGKTVISTIDINLQKFAEDKLNEVMKAIRTSGVYESPWGNYKYKPYKDKNNQNQSPQANTGVVVVEKVNSGEILAMASVPSFNPNLFSEGISSEDFKSLFPENEDDLLAPRPLLNIATQTAIQPGSVFKMVTGLAALEKGWSKYTKIRDGGYVEVGRAKHRCWYYAQYGRTHGSLDLAGALENSCNYYFYSLALGEDQRSGKKLNVRVDIEDINEMAKKAGFGEKTGLEIKVPSEQRGSLPDKETKKAIAKSRLNNYLNNNIDKYVADKKLYNKEGAIREILSWLDDEKEKSRSDIIGILSDLGLEPLNPLPGTKDGLADIIKFTYFIDARWGLSNTLNATIGQGEVSTTPIQISNYISTIANGGKRYKTSLVKGIKDGDKREDKFHDYEETGISGENLLAVREGMEQLINEGYVKSVFKDLPIKVAGKTGSAEKSGINPATGEEYSAFAWFVCYAPAEKPEIAVTTLIFQGRTGSNAAPLARDVVAEYFKLKPPDREAGTLSSSNNQE